MAFANEECLSPRPRLALQLGTHEFCQKCEDEADDVYASALTALVSANITNSKELESMMLNISLYFYIHM